MTQSIAIRPMEDADIAQVHAIECICFSAPWSENSFYDEIHSNICARYLVAEEDGKIAGYGGMWLIINEAHITNIAVHPDFRRRKVGTKILRDMMKLADQELGIRKMTLEVRKSNYTAQSMYRKFGFLTVGERKKYYADNEDAIIMWCDDISEFI